jgi:pyrimidine-nucleoside phosphorylase
MAGNWIEIKEAVEVLNGDDPEGSEDLKKLSLILAGWMIYLGGKAPTPEAGYSLAEGTIYDGTGINAFLEMIEAQGGDISIFESGRAFESFHKPGATLVLTAWESGYITEMDTTKIGWAVQRTGAGREKAGEPVDPHAGIEFHARRGTLVGEGQPIVTLYATDAEMLAEPAELLREAIRFSVTPPPPVPQVSRIFTRESAEAFLNDTI